MPPTADYHSRINRDLLARIPPQARTILEVGCGTGALGAAFKASHPQTHYVGLEAAEGAAEHARDVLEHLRDPWSCLQRQSPLLKPQGTLLACIPNVQHWSVIWMLLRGEWPLADEGLFDRTHLRWFTRSGITSMMRQAGLTIQEIQPRIFDPAKALAFVQALEPALPRLGLEAKTLLAGTAPLQYVIVATRS